MPSIGSGNTVDASFEVLREAHRREPNPSCETRLERLSRLRRAVIQHQDEIAGAISRDFGNRSAHETKLTEIHMTISAIRYTQKHLKGWMRSERRSVPATLLPARARVHHQPLGVVGILSPWNYPFQLAMMPLTAALAAGNVVLLKPSEHTPRTSALIERMMADVFEPDIVDVITGGADVGEAFAALPFDHLFFTGSMRVGKAVMKAAADNLTPVTLELGGKSPTIVQEDYPVDRAAARITAAKWLNAGQTCIAPDYLLVAENKVERMVDELVAHVHRYYPSLAANPDYTSVISDRHYRRLAELVDDAAAKGGRVTIVNPRGETLPPAARKLAPTLLTNVTDDMIAMQEEIFGPVLPIVAYRTLDDAIDYVNARPRPLALYVFDQDKARAADVIERTISGGACVNDALLQFAVDDLPFGGVGPSGMGAYHGKEGFETFSHKRGVFYQAYWNGAGLLVPPYGERIERLLRALIRA